MIYKLALLSFVVSAFDPSIYPPVNLIPPINPSWRNALQLSRADSAVYGCINKNHWALTYDDGPSDVTEVVLDVLQKKNTKATFFVLGSNVLQYPELLVRAHEEGHQIAIHTWSHPDLVTLTDDQVIAEIVWTMRIIKDLIGITPTAFRPPYGSFDGRIQRIVTGLGLKNIMWNKDTNDWVFNNWSPNADLPIVSPPYTKKDSPTAITNFVKTWMQEPANGTISLQHDIMLHPVSQVEPILNIVTESSYTLTNISRCIGSSAYDERIWSTLRVRFSTTSKINGESRTKITTPNYNSRNTEPTSYSPTPSLNPGNNLESQSFKLITPMSLLLSFLLSLLLLI